MIFKKNKQILFIMGTGHCGSTLLDLIPGSHSKAFSLGEVNKVLVAKNSEQVCALCHDECTIWTKGFIDELKRLYRYNPLDKILSKIHSKFSPEVKFYKAIFKKSNNEILIDSTKNPNWIIKNATKLIKANYDVKLLYLSRDGRAVVNSLYRKNKDKELNFLSKKWVIKIVKINRCYLEWEDYSKMQIKYEDLAKQPAETINTILKKLNLEYEPKMLRFWEHKHHTVNGNAGTKTLVLKFQDIQRHKNVNWELNKKGYYKNHELGIKFDERWKRELSDKELDQVEKIIGDYNQELIDA